MLCARRPRALSRRLRGDRAQLVASEFASYAPDMKLALVFNFGCFVTALAFATSWLCGEDPLGGATLTGRSLDAAAAGAACGLPLLLCSALSRTRWARREAPVMALLHDAQAEALAPVLRGLNFPQTLALTALAVLPCLLLLLPAFHAVCVTTAAFVQQHLEASAHVRLQVPLGWRHEVTAAGTALVSGTFAAYHAAAALTVRESQKSAIRSAVLSSDRYWAFRASFERGGGGSSAVAGAAADNSSSALAAADSSSHGGGGGSKPVLGTTAVFSCNEAEGLSAGDSSSSEAAALRTTAAFKTLSVLWLILRTKSAQLGYILTFTNVAYYCLIWDAAGDLAAPAAAALVATAGEAFFVKTSLDLLE